MNYYQDFKELILHSSTNKRMRLKFLCNSCKYLIFNAVIEFVHKKNLVIIEFTEMSKFNYDCQVYDNFLK